MKKQFWFLIAIVLVVLLLGGFAWMRLSKDTSDAASSPNGETEIIPDDPNEPWPDLTADASPDASDGTHSSASDSSTPGTTPGTPAPRQSGSPGRHGKFRFFF